MTTLETLHLSSDYIESFQCGNRKIQSQAEPGFFYAAFLANSAKRFFLASDISPVSA